MHQRGEAERLHPACCKRSALRRWGITWLCVCRCVCANVHTDSFKDAYPHSALLAGLRDMWKGLAPVAMVVSSELESIWDVAYLLMPNLFSGLFHFSWEPRFPFLYLWMTENVPPIKQPFGMALDHQQLSISLSKTLNVKPWAAKLLLLYMRESHCLVLTSRTLQLVLKHSTSSSPSP